MAFIPTPQGVEVVLHATQESIPVVNVMHVNINGPVTLTDMNDLLLIFDNWVTTDLLPQLSNSYVLNDITITDISVANGQQVQQVYTTGNQGSITGSQAAANAAAVASFRTGFTGRSFRGRFYVGGLAQASLLSAHYLVVADQTNIATIFQNLLDALTLAGYALSVLSKVAAGVARVAGLLTEIVTIIVDQKIDSQRRRTAN